MLTQQQNDVFTRVGPGTPMGNLLRRYWHPVGCTALVTSKPKRVTVLGEELVLYRGASGEPALMQLRCSHRNVALDYGRVEGDSIRCPYHGWLFNKDGRCAAQPSEPDAASYKDDFSLRAYPTQEISGLVFAYMGPAPAPVLPLYDVLTMKGGSKQIRTYKIHANWFQGAENTVDSTHFSWLHGYTFPPFSAKKTDARFERTDYGLQVYIGLPGGPMDSGPAIFPAHNRFALPDGHGGMTQVLFYRVPADDYSHENYMVAFRPSADGSDDPNVGAVRFETKVGEYMPLEGDWWGIDLGDQDRMAMEQQSEIADRTREHLVSGDIGIVRLRRLFREALEAVERGEDPIGVIRDPAKQHVDLGLRVGALLDTQEGADYSAGLFAEAEKV